MQSKTYRNYGYHIIQPPPPLCQLRTPFQHLDLIFRMILPPSLPRVIYLHTYLHNAFEVYYMPRADLSSVRGPPPPSPPIALAQTKQTYTRGTCGFQPRTKEPRPAMQKVSPRNLIPNYSQSYTCEPWVCRDGVSVSGGIRQGFEPGRGYSEWEGEGWW